MISPTHSIQSTTNKQKKFNRNSLFLFSFSLNADPKVLVVARFMSDRKKKKKYE